MSTSPIRPTDPNILDIIFGQLRDLAQNIRELDRKNDRRFDQLDNRLDDFADATDKRVTDLETDNETAKAVALALGKREVRATDKRRHWVNIAFGLIGALLASGFGEMIHVLATGHP